MKKIGQHFAQEVEAAGLAGRPFSWGDDGLFEFGPAMTPAEVASVQALYSAHDPDAVVSPQ